MADKLRSKIMAEMGFSRDSIVEKNAAKARGGPTEYQQYSAAKYKDLEAIRSFIAFVYGDLVTDYMGIGYSKRAAIEAARPASKLLKKAMMGYFYELYPNSGTKATQVF